MDSPQLRAGLAQLLNAWEAGSIDETEVRDTAEAYELAWTESGRYDDVPLDRTPPTWFATMEVLSALADLHVRWFTRDDIPALRSCLQGIELDPVEARSAWIAHFDGIDWKARRFEVRDDPFYKSTDRAV